MIAASVFTACHTVQLYGCVFSTLQNALTLLVESRADPERVVARRANGDNWGRDAVGAKVECEC